ncbi:MAG: M1 family metallopeptidase [Ideonella sp.]
MAASRSVTNRFTADCPDIVRNICSTLLRHCLVVLVLVFGCAASASERFDFDQTPGHLPKQVVPSRYELRLDLDPASDSFSGQAGISVRVRQPVDAIELHAFELTASRIRLIDPRGAARAMSATALPASQSWRLVPDDGRAIAAGSYRIEVDYSGKVHVAGEGLYAAPYEQRGTRQRMLATQLEAISARKLFPSFDEPSFRAVFAITVRAPVGYDVASNMPRTARRVEGRTVVHRFAATPAMPSYLVSVVVGRFDVLQGKSDGIPLRILTSEGKRAMAAFAMRVTEQVLPFYSRYFGIPYALPKLDQLAVPSVRWGAMEDWGLISYAEDNLLIDPERSSPAARRGVYSTVAHEIAHQWFGNLVTAASWNEIWLNEAFATWLEQKTSDHFNPAWKVPLQSRRWLDEAMALDAGSATRAIRSGPVSEAAVFDIFDSVTYAKGGAVLTMLEQWAGPSVFQKGLADYMKGQRLSNATAADLWFYIGRASHKDAAGMAASWTDQKGFPLVQATSRCEAGQQHVTLTQQRFVNADGAPSDQRWKIPVRLRRGAQLSTVLLEGASGDFAIGSCSDDPVVVNAGGVGFYRVAYDSATLARLIGTFTELPDTERMALLSDSFALMQAGKGPSKAWFDLLQKLSRVGDSSRTMLWLVARGQMDFLDKALVGLPAQAQLHDIGRRLLAPQLAELGWQPAPGEDEQTGELRGTLIGMLARFEDPQTIAQAVRAFDDDDAGRSRLPAALRSAVTTAVGMHADSAHFERLLAKLKSADGEEERWRLLDALASGRDRARAQQLLAQALTGIAPANVASAIPGVVAGRSPFGDEAYRFTLDNFSRLGELSGSWGRTWLLPRAASGFSDRGRAQQLIDDQRRLSGADGDAPAAQQAESIRLRAAVRERETDKPSGKLREPTAD